MPNYIGIFIFKKFHKHSDGFQNFMSSWESWSKISKLQEVGNFKDFCSKASLFKHTYVAEFLEIILALTKL